LFCRKFWNRQQRLKMKLSWLPLKWIPNHDWKCCAKAIHRFRTTCKEVFLIRMKALLQKSDSQGDKFYIRGVSWPTAT
jgi:hypothetical protein